MIPDAAWIVRSIASVSRSGPLMPNPVPKKDALAASLAHLLNGVPHVPRRNKLSLLDIHPAAALPCRDQQVGLPAQKRGYLQHVHGFGHSRHVGGLVDVGQHGNPEGFANLAENAKTFLKTRPAKAADRGAIGLVVRGLEDVRKLFLASDRSNRPAILSAWASLSMTHGPAMRKSSPPPMVTLPTWKGWFTPAFSVSPFPAGETSPRKLLRADVGGASGSHRTLSQKQRTADAVPAVWT